MIKSFSEYIAEDVQGLPDSLDLANDILDLISKSDHRSDSYTRVGKKEYTHPIQFDLEVEVRFDSNPNFESDEHFNNLQWEEINFDKYGFAIDANTIFDKNNIIPLIIVTMILNPNFDYVNELKERLIDIMRHETSHTNQFGWNRRPFKEKISSPKKRELSKNNYKYFLLPEEIEAMVDGMYKRSKEENKGIDVIFDNYLIPFIKEGMINSSEYYNIFKTWLIRALEKYPDVKVSNDKKTSQIINSI